jgi:hypothetical protein
MAGFFDNQQPGFLSGLTGGPWSADQGNNSAMSRGLLAAALGLLANSGRRGFAQNLGEAGIQGMQGFYGAKDEQRRNSMQDWQFSEMKRQAERQRRLDETHDILRDLPRRFMRGGGSPSVDATGGPETDVNAPNNVARPASLDEDGLFNAMMLVDPVAAYRFRGERSKATLDDMKAKRMGSVLESIDRWSGAGNDAVVRQTGNLAPTVANGQIQQAAERQSPLYGIPREAIDADLAFNDGKNIGTWLDKRGSPNIEFINGVAIDKNRASPGMSIPQVAQNGQASQILPDPTAPGGFRVIAPQGAMDTYGAYRQIDEQSKAAFDPLKVYNPKTRREEYVPRSEIGRVPPNVQASRDGERLTILRQELDTARQRGNRADIEALEREIGRTPGGRLPAGPSSLEAAQGRYDEAVQTDLAGRRKTIYDSAEVASSKITDYQRLSQLLAQHDGGTLSPKGLEIARTLNSMGLKIDPSTGNKEAAQALANKMALDLRNPAGGAGMPGAMSDADRQFLANMIPSLGTTAEGRAQMIGYATAIERRKVEVAQFARNYESKYGRLDNEFFDQLQRWSSGHPLFTRPSRGATGGW